MGRPLVLQRLSIRQLRNLERVELEAATRVNVIAGNNGHGKTSVLEAIYLVATSRSFRTARLADAVQHGAAHASVRATFEESWEGGPVAREQSLGLSGNRRTARINGEAPRSLALYATRSPVVVFEPQQMILSMGPAADRRTLLDRVTMFTHPDVAVDRARYQTALRDRQRLLADRWPRTEGPELDAYETLMAEHGAAMTRARREASALLAEELERAWKRIAAPGTTLGAAYAPGGSEDQAEARARLLETRALDARRKATTFGPHRDDMELGIDGHPARVVGSQGQHRAITLALKSAELVCISEARGLEPILLLDDVSSELDSERTAALFEFLATTASQIFITTTRRDLIVTPARSGLERRDFEVRGGVLTAVS